MPNPKHTLVTVEESAVRESDPRQVFDHALTEALGTEGEVVGLVLRAELEPGVELLDWLAQWQQRLGGEGKHLVVIAEDPAQLQCLELSHPDQNLVCMSSLEQWHRTYPDEPAPAGAPQPDAAPVTPPEQPPQGTVPPGGEGEEQSVPPIMVGVGTVADTAGEYACRGCGMTRMFMKGDKVGRCESAECQHPDWGWKFVFELF
jgi:hypothetical protein